MLGSAGMPRLQALLFALPLAVACGSSDGGSDLFGGGGGTAATASSNPDASVGASGGSSTGTGGSGNLGSGGSSTGGTSPSGGTGGVGAAAVGGATSPGGGTGAGGAVAAGGSVTVLPDGGIVLADGGIVVPGQLPTGLIVTQACADCAAAYCPDETAACTADPDCVTGVQCLNTCIFPPACAACFLVNGVTSAPESAKALSSCATQYCNMCPQFG